MDAGAITARACVDHEQPLARLDGEAQLLERELSAEALAESSNLECRRCHGSAFS